MHHNNCLYLSHKSLELERRLKEVFPKLPPASSFLDFAVSLRSMGVSSLKHFISQQKDEISEDLRLQIGIILNQFNYMFVILYKIILIKLNHFYCLVKGFFNFRLRKHRWRWEFQGTWQKCRQGFSETQTFEQHLVWCFAITLSETNWFVERFRYIWFRSTFNYLCWLMSPKFKF